MTIDVYKSPESEILAEPLAAAEFYVVSPRKFLILFIATLGMYGVYWFYKHWQQYKIKHNDDMWPVMRAIFFIFFTHSLFESINVRLNEKQSDYKWSSGTLATIYVIVSLVENVANQMSNRGIGNPITGILGIAFLPLLTWILYKAQLAANIACGDPDGETNSTITGLNILWIVIGVVLWLLAGIGVLSLFVAL